METGYATVYTIPLQSVKEKLVTLGEEGQWSTLQKKKYHISRKDC